MLICIYFNNTNHNYYKYTYVHINHTHSPGAVTNLRSMSSMPFLTTKLSISTLVCSFYCLCFLEFVIGAKIYS